MQLTAREISLGILWCAQKRARFVWGLGEKCLTAESVQGTTLTLQGVDNVHGCHGLPLGVLGVGDGITDDVLEEHLQDTAGLLVDETGDALHTTTASETADCGLGDTLDVITQYFAVTLGASLSKTLASFTTSRHVDSSKVKLRMKNPLENFGYSTSRERAYAPVFNFSFTFRSSRPITMRIFNL